MPFPAPREPGLLNTEMFDWLDSSIFHLVNGKVNRARHDYIYACRVRARIDPQLWRKGTQKRFDEVFMKIQQNVFDKDCG